MTHRIINPQRAAKHFASCVLRAGKTRNIDDFYEAAEVARELADHLKTSPVPLVLPRKDNAKVWEAIAVLANGFAVLLDEDA